MPGIYELTPMLAVEGYAEAGICDQDKELLIYGEDERTILKYNGNDSALRDGTALCLKNPNTIVRNLTYVFEPLSWEYGHPDNFNVAIFNACYGTTENVFFRIVGSSKASYLYHNDQNDLNKPANNVINCTFFHDLGSVLDNYSGRCNFINIATNVTTKGTNTNVITEVFGTSSMNLENLISASKENEAFNTNQVGVYYGTHAWK